MSRRAGGRITPRDDIRVTGGHGPEWFSHEGRPVFLNGGKQVAHTLKVYVVAPAGRYIPGYGERQVGGFFELPADVARALVERDPGLRLDDEPKKAARKEAAKDDEVKDDAS